MTRKTKVIPVSEEIPPEHCENIVYKPLSITDLTPANLLGKGWCYRGDLSVQDFTQGTGVPYMEEQAKEYTERKQEEAIRVTNRQCIQFRLINTSAIPITSKAFDTTEDSNIFNGTDDIIIPNAPVASSASSVTSSGFTANWSASIGATGYYLDVATDSAFTSYVSGYQNLDVSNVTSYAVTGLSQTTNYYYRVRAYNSNGTSTNSNTVTQITKTIYNDYFLPSYNELNAMYENLHLYGLGGFNNTEYYWSSSEESATQAYAQMFLDGSQSAFNKSNYVVYNIRACRSFTAPLGSYSLRDTGQAGGLIFYIDGNTYYEASPEDLGHSIWSNVTSTYIGTTGTAIGDGENNTSDIITQSGHTDSAAKLCNDLEVEN